MLEIKNTYKNPTKLTSNFEYLFIMKGIQDLIYEI